MRCIARSCCAECSVSLTLVGGVDVEVSVSHVYRHRVSVALHGCTWPGQQYKDVRAMGVHVCIRWMYHMDGNAWTSQDMNDDMLYHIVCLIRCIGLHVVVS